MAGRKDNGDGSLTKRADGRWEARVTLPNGKRKSFYGKTKEEVKKKLEQTKRDIHDGLPVVSEKQTVGQYLEEWLVAVKLQVRYSTWYNYGVYIHNHLIPAFGHVSLKKLTPQQIQAFYARELDAGFSSTTIQLIHEVLHRSLDDALRMGVVQRNILDMVKRPRRAHYEMSVLSEAQVRQFLSGIKGDRFEALYILALTTGMREGELLGLRWQDIDFENGALVIRMALHKVLGRIYLADTKSASSRRRIALTQIALEALRCRMAMQIEEQTSFGALWENSLNLVFPNTLGRMMSPTDFSGKVFKRVLKQLGFADMRFHELRHTCATLLLSRGVNIKVVSELLGHSDVSITLRVYGHVLPHMQDRAVHEMESIISIPDELSSDLSSNT